MLPSLFRGYLLEISSKTFAPFTSTLVAMAQPSETTKSTFSRRLLDKVSAARAMLQLSTLGAYSRQRSISQHLTKGGFHVHQELCDRGGRRSLTRRASVRLDLGRDDRWP